jgi:putative ABC transport system permease protein
MRAQNGHDQQRRLHRAAAGWADAWWRDITYTIRSLAHSAGFTAAVILTLALGLGTNAAVFSFLDRVFLRAPSGVAAPKQVRRLWVEQPIGIAKVQSIEHTLTYHAYRVVAAAISDKALLALYATQANVPIGRADAPATATLTYATSTYFPALGVGPLLGRTFTDAEADVHSAERVVVVGYSFWRDRLGGDARAIGSTLTIDDRVFTVIGVAPPGFSGIDLQESELWVPLGTFPTRETARVSFWDSSVIFFSAFARVAPGTDDRQLEARATTAYRRAPVTDFSPNPDAQLFFRSIIDARGPGAESKEVSIAVRLGIVAVLILIITVANVVNLLLAHAMMRRREAAVRLALGISRARLMRLFIVESVLLSIAAGAAALVSAQVTGAVLRSLLLPGIHVADGVLRWQVVVVAMAASVITGIVAGWVPAVRGSTLELTHSLKTAALHGTADRSILPTILVGAQAALSVLLLVGAALCVASLMNVQRLRIGFDVTRLAYARISLPEGQRADTGAFANDMRAAGDRVRGVPGVEAVAFARNEPMTWPGRLVLYTATDSSGAGNGPDAVPNYVSGNFFNAIGSRFLRGRTFSDSSSSSANLVVVNQALARAFWPDRDPIGECVRIQQRNGPCLTVSGVVADAIVQQLTEQPTPQLYLPIFQSVRGQRPPSVMVIRADAQRLEFAMAQAARALHDEFPRGEPSVVSMGDRLAPQYRPWRLGATLFSVFGVLALAVAALGIYGNVAHSVAQRRHEIGIRIALGATYRDIIKDVVGRGVRPVVIGGVVGAASAIVGARLISSLLYGVVPWNPFLIASVVSTLVLVAALAAFTPGWRASRIDPVRAMAAD